MSGERDYLLDTNMLGYLVSVSNGSTEAKEQRVAAVLEKVKQSSRRLFISSITVGECEYGLLVAPKADKEKQDVARAVLASFPEAMVLAVDNNVAKRYYCALRAALFSTYAPKGRRGTARTNYIAEWTDPTTQKELGVDENDVWIASVAMAYNLTLVSDDQMRHIRDAAGLELSMQNWATTT
jgi:tRNA(fMet)-specific endonuclease VapC